MIRAAVRRWNDYWFRPAPLLNLAVFRIAAAGGQFLIWTFLWKPLAPQGDFLRLAEIPRLYSPMVATRVLLAPFHFAGPPPLVFVVGVYLITTGAALLATVGLFTNAAMGTLAAGTILLQSYTYSFGDFHHPEALMAISLAALALSPCGRVLSIDSLRRRGREVGRWHPAHESRARHRMSAFARWPVQLLVWMLSLIYMSAAYYKLKTGGLAWLNGHTLQFYLLQDGLRWGQTWAVKMAGWHALAVVLSAASLAFESGFFLVIFFPRLLMIAVPVGFGLHLSIQVLMKAGFFEYFALYLALIPWAELLQWREKRRASSTTAGWAPRAITGFQSGPGQPRARGRLATASPPRRR